MKFTAPIFILKHQAKALSRKERIPLHQALDRIANREGFSAWGLLSAKAALDEPGKTLFAQLAPGDLVLVASRPGHGKTVLGLDLAIKAMRQGAHAAFFTLEFTKASVAECFTSLGERMDNFADRFLVDTSDQICADYIVDRLANAAPKSFVVIDYLQLLDQKRQNADLMTQVQKLKAFARERDLIVVCLSQIDRSYDPTIRSSPNVDDVRLPNPLDLSLFDRTCFLNQGRLDFSRDSVSPAKAGAV